MDQSEWSTTESSFKHTVLELTTYSHENSTSPHWRITVVFALWCNNILFFHTGFIIISTRLDISMLTAEKRPNCTSTRPQKTISTKYRHQADNDWNHQTPHSVKLCKRVSKEASKSVHLHYISCYSTFFSSSCPAGLLHLTANLCAVTASPVKLGVFLKSQQVWVVLCISS